jgi:HSP20 family molecular chaperone IbpA
MLLLLASMLEGLKGFASAQPIEVIGGGEVEYQRTVPFATASRRTAMETYRKDGNYVVRVDLPGVDPKDLNVHLEGDLLTIKAERKAEEKGPEYRETYYGKFERTMTLPHGVKAEKLPHTMSMVYLSWWCRCPLSLLARRSRFKSRPARQSSPRLRKFSRLVN